jgi:hypothetical protein
MRYLLLMIGIIVASSATSTPAKAQNYPWCAQYAGAGGGATNCGFISFEQCMETIRGMGGFCEQNNWYQPPPGPHSKSPPSRP